MIEIPEKGSKWRDLANLACVVVWADSKSVVYECGDFRIHATRSEFLSKHKQASS